MLEGSGFRVGCAGELLQGRDARIAKKRNTWLHTRVVVVLDLTVRGRFAEFRM